MTLHFNPDCTHKGRLLTALRDKYWQRDYWGVLELAPQLRGRSIEDVTPEEQCVVSVYLALARFLLGAATYDEADTAMAAADAEFMALGRFAYVAELRVWRIMVCNSQTPGSEMLGQLVDRFTDGLPATPEVMTHHEIMLGMLAEAAANSRDAIVHYRRALRLTRSLEGKPCLRESTARLLAPLLVRRSMAAALALLRAGGVPGHQLEICLNTRRPEL